jgi:predicted alpha-1,2-mannosidase
MLLFWELVLLYGKNLKNGPAMRLSLTSFCILALLVTACTSSSDGDDKTPFDYVDPFIGTGGHGHTYPGASRPFGMVQLSPDTRLDGWDGCSGYHFTDSVVYGFSHTHLSGTGVSDYGDILFMPTTGPVNFDNGAKNGPDSGYASRFSKSSEKATPGYYEVNLTDYDIDVELTCTERAGFHHYTYPEDGPGHIIVDLEHRDQLLEADVKLANSHEIEGYRISKAWAVEQHVYFVAQFSQAIGEYEFHNGNVLINGKDTAERVTKGAFTFDCDPLEPLQVRVGISAVSIENARENLVAEITNWDFSRVKTEAKAAWDLELNKIEVEGGTEDARTIFYTALYHSFLNPNLFSDVNGEYRGTDLQVHKSDGENVYTVFSLWDTFRGAHPLFTLTQRDRTSDFISTFLKQYEHGGQLPVWELAGNYTGCMIGYHSVPVIADAYAKGITDFDLDKAFEAMTHSAEKDHLGLEHYKEKGFISSGDESESVSKTLEYAYDDWCIALMAKELNKEDDYKDYLMRAQHYKNLFDPNTGFLRAKKEANWYGPFDPHEVNFHYTEANAWQYSMFVPQDIEGLIQLLGGKQQFEAHLDKMFAANENTSGRDQADITGLIGQYAHGNEPSHHMAYLYNYVNKPWKSQERVREIMGRMYSTQPDGLSGNEDCGQMSSWYVLSAMGFYSVTPGLPYYTIGSPIFDKVTMHLENGKDFVIEAKDNSAKAIYVHKTTLNGEAHPSTYLMHDAIMDGGTFTFEMGETIHTDYGSNDADLPPSAITDYEYVPVPYFQTEAKTFIEALELEMGVAGSEHSVYYTTDGSAPTASEGSLYEGLLSLEKTTIVKAVAIHADGTTSPIVTSEYIKIPEGRSIKLISKYENQYAAGGEHALIDFQRGASNFRTGDWQGYWDQDFEAVVDLGSVQTVNKISASFLQDIKSWIWYPTLVEYSISPDGQHWTIIDDLITAFPQDKYGAFTAEYPVEKRMSTRYIKVRAKHVDQCPHWHLGAGNPTWIMIDEIVIE